MSEPRTRPVSLVERVVTTLAGPALMVLATRVPLPHVDAGPAGRDMSIAGLGLVPFLTAYGLVELVALCVPRWRLARHRPATRAKLERASNGLAVLLAVLQALGVTAFLSGEGALHGWPQQLTVMATLVAGTCLLAVAARWVTRRGLANGFVLLWATSAVAELAGGDALRRASREGPRSATVLIVAMITIFVATLVAVGGRRRPIVPVPASSIVPVTFASALLVLPATLASFHLPTRALAELLARDQGFVLLAAAMGATLAAAPLMHRTDEVAALLRRLGLDVDVSTAAGALWGAMPPTVAYIALLVVGGLACARVAPGAAYVSIAIVAAVVWDVAGALAMHLRRRDLVVVAEERRTYAAAPLCAALAQRGIPAYARGLGAASLLQAFGPYAPVEVFVPSAEAARASAVLGGLGLDAPPEEEAPRAPIAAPVQMPRTIALMGLLAVAVAVWRVPLVTAPVLTGPRAQIAVVRVDDAAAPFQDEADDTAPEGAAFYREAVPLGPGKQGTSLYARIVPGASETREAAWARLKPWLEGHALPQGDRWAWQEVLEPVDDPPTVWRPVALRTLVLTGDPILGTEDVAHADVGQETEGLSGWYVLVTLRPPAAERFRVATRDWVQRRLAILVDGRVDSAPVVKSEIGGGRLTITMGAGEPEKQLADARRLAASLGGD
ncbi:MAG TPA: hypothetical protein VIF15_19660 [Polyangiaceae bacterium]